MKRIFLGAYILTHTTTSTSPAMWRLPCTSQLCTVDFELARSILVDCTPSGYKLVKVYPLVTTELYPHHWLCYYQFVNSGSNHAPDYQITYFILNDIKNDFKSCCPSGCEVGTVSVTVVPENEEIFILVNFTRNCLCRNTFREENVYPYSECTCDPSANRHSGTPTVTVTVAQPAVGSDNTDNE